jgi:hypothetical protein
MSVYLDLRISNLLRDMNPISAGFIVRFALILILSFGVFFVADYLRTPSGGAPVSATVGR